jgi:hypothetical protein
MGLAISVFSNDLGATLILGLAERTGFDLSERSDAAKLRDDLASMCADNKSPRLRHAPLLLGNSPVEFGPQPCPWP